MSEKVSLNLKVSTLTKAMIAECARLEHRTVSAYVDAMVEMDVKAKNLSPEMLQPAKVKKRAEVQHDMELPDYLDRDVWEEWVEYKAGRGKPMLASTIKYSFREMAKAHANGWDVNELLREALASQWLGFVFEKHRNTRCGTPTDLLSEDDQKQQRYTKLLEQLMNLSVDEKLVSPVFYQQFIGMLHETDQLVDVPQILWMFDQFKMINKGLEWNNSILQRAVDDHHVLNEKGRFDVLRAGERI